ncbi:MAG: hypothetical protein K9N23_20560 [Akkermansiaceae bacterium]|nr:hypothetical protein [Akkermansiaceae bacterium]
MPDHPSTPQAPIEVEVLEIDGQAPAAPSPVSASPPPPGLRPYNPWDDRESDETPGSPFSRATWQAGTGQLRTLNPIWWPLILILGCIALFLILTVGVMLAIVFLTFRLLRGILRALFS